MSSTTSTAPTLAALQDDIATLKRDVTSLLEHLRDGAASNTESAIEQLDKNSQRLCRGAAAESERMAKALTQQIEEHPVMTLLIAAGVAYAGARLLLR